MDATQTTKAKFRLGDLYITRNAAMQLSDADVKDALVRHLQGDWGDLGAEDWEENELSLRDGYRLLSVYTAKDGTRFWIITEHDRSATTVLLPEDY